MIKNIINTFNKIIEYNYKNHNKLDIKNTIKNNFTNLDKTTKNIMKIGLKFCLILGIIALIILVTYNFKIDFPILFSIGFILFKLSLTFGVEFIICGFAVDKIKKELV